MILVAKPVNKSQGRLPNFVTISASKVAMRSVIFDADNYVVPKVINPIDFIPNLSFPFHLKVSIKAMKVCPQYNSKKGCSFGHCYRFHICRLWLSDTIHKKTCLLLHGILGTHNLNLFNSIYRPTTSNNDKGINNHLRREAQINYNLELWKVCDKSNLICVHSIDEFELCVNMQCKLFHIRLMFQWEIFIDGNWNKFTSKQNESLEKDYCNPKNAAIIKQVKPSNPFCQVLGQGSCTVNYEKFAIYALNSMFKIRRLSTPSDVACNNSFATRWLWYWQDKSHAWHLYSSGLTNEWFVIPLSDYIESLYLSGIKEVSLTLNGLPYSLNFDSMTQMNLDSMDVSAVRRRPLLSIVEDWNDVTFRNLWSKIDVPLEANKKSVFVRNEVIFTSPEYAFVVKMLHSLPTISDVKIERIENHYLWDQYQMKKRQIIEKYDGSLNAANEQYLFHDSSLSNVDHVCINNFSHSSLGVRLGLGFGKGIYFSNLASLSNAVASVSEENYKSMYVALVLVGEATVGDESMYQPPSVYSGSDITFDTTVNHSNFPAIFVKYNSDEFYPAYYVEYKY